MFLYFLGSSLPDQLASLQAMSPGATSPTLGTTDPNLGAAAPTLDPTASTLGVTNSMNGLAQSTHGMEQLAQASMQSPRLATQNPMYNTINFAPDTNNVSLNSNGLPGYNPVDINNTEATNPEVIQAIRSQGIANVKQEKDNQGSHSVNPNIHQGDTSNLPHGLMR